MLVLDGYGLRVAVERRHLQVSDGICDERRSGRLSRATAGLKRLVVLGHTGFVTLEALRLLRDCGAVFMQIDADGQVVVASGPAGLDDARLRRSQALAPSNGVGMRIARELVRQKLEGQLALVSRLPDGRASAGVIRQSLGGLDRAAIPAQLRLLESAGAAAYWKVWERIPVRFARKDERKVPDHWRTFGTRGSPLANGPRLAATPANSILNYLYAIIEGEARIAAMTMGLDPGMGVLHADQPARDSLALDLMEPCRPEVDAYLLEMLRRQIFRASDFFETRQGVCRLMPPLTHMLCETATHWGRRIAPIAERAAGAFASALGSRVRHLPTPLTQAQRSAGRAATRQQPRRQPKSPKPALIAACRMCGEVLPSLGRSYCNDCLPTANAESLSKFQEAGPAALAKMMAEGRDTSHGGAAAHKRAANLARRQQEAAEWERHHGSPDSEEFRLGILQRLQGVPLRKMAKATGLSIRYCSIIRRGLSVPHPRHWDVLAEIGGVRLRNSSAYLRPRTTASPQ